MQKINKLDSQCEHECVIGTCHIDGERTILYNNQCISKTDDFNIFLFNFCPACGQELNLEKIEKQTLVCFQKSR